MTIVQIQKNGIIAFPANLREKYNFEEGKILRLVDVGDGSFFLIPFESKVVKSGEKVAQKMNVSGVSLEELLETLDEERADYYKEYYASRRSEQSK